MKINIYSFTDNGIDRTTAHGWMVDLCKKIPYKTFMVRRNFMRRDKLVYTLLFVRHIMADDILRIASKMEISTNTCVNHEKWKSIKKIITALKEKNV